MVNKVISLILILFFTLKSNAQQNDTVYFANNNIAIRKQNDSIYFYNSLGEIRKIINLKNKKSTSFGLPIEVQNIIYSGKIPEKIEISEETFPTYLYTQKYSDAGVVLCREHIFYNKLCLKTGYEEICPDDTGGSDYHFGGKNIYKYNQFGLLTTIKNGFINKYNENGQLIAKCYKNKKTKIIDTVYIYNYESNRLAELIKKSNGKKEAKYIYKYNKNELLVEIIASYYIKSYNERRKSILFEYNNQNQIIAVSEIKILGDFKSKHTFLTYHYDTQHRINRIQINYIHSYSNKDYHYAYDTNGNLITITLDDKTLQKYKYDSDGTLIHIYNRWGVDKGYLKY